MRAFTSATLADNPDAIAPDGSEVRLVQATDRASIVHCTLPAGATTVAVRHRTVEEIWFFLTGTGEVWRSEGAAEEVLPVEAGRSLTIPLGTSFQFRATGGMALTFLIATVPPWPGDAEAERVEGRWPPSVP